MELSIDTAADACADEPIHLSGAIQPHGYLVACDRDDWQVRHVSSNIHDLLDRPAASLLGDDVRDELSSDVVQAALDAIALLEPGRPAQWCCRNNIGPLGQLCNVAVHLDGRLVVFEFEPVRRTWHDASASLLADGLIGRVLAHAGGSDFAEAAVLQVRRLTGFDRVMVYRFLHDGSGEVVAEARDSGVASYFGLRFPAFDIPAQARALYVRNRIRAIPDAGYASVPLVSAETAPLDLGQSLLRSVAPVHLEYLANMGVASSLSVSIVSGDRLQGLLVCHHATPLQVDPPVRAALELFGRFMSLRVTSQEQETLIEEAGAVDYLTDSIGESVRRTTDLQAALLRWAPAVRVLFDADAVAVHADGRWAGTGDVIDADELAAVAGWLADARSTGVVHADRRTHWFDGPGRYAGVLALQVVPGTWLVLLRCELVETVHWAGRPDKPTVGDDGARIGPRRSFETWRDTVRGQSRPWTGADLRKAQRFCRGLSGVGRRGDDATADDAARMRSRQGAIDERRQRLLDVAGMLEALPPLDDELSRAIADHVHRFDRQLRDLILRTDFAPRPVVDAAASQGTDA